MTEPCALPSCKRNTVEKVTQIRIRLDETLLGCTSGDGLAALLAALAGRLLDEHEGDVIAVAEYLRGFADFLEEELLH